ncbi:hypothetical protein ABZ726_33300 [Streptomyces hundungensis]|uniref:hypothetical protein n=1 Tax=Streptomyces hundungensis TaxID=1077946 RepID=UPI0033F8E3BF
MNSSTAASEQGAENAQLGSIDVLRQIPRGQLLAQASQLLTLAKDMVQRAVVTERLRGTSWDEVGECVGGVSRSAAHNRYSYLVKEWQDEQQGLSEDESLSSSFAELQQMWEQSAALIKSQAVLIGLQHLTGSVAARSVYLSLEPAEDVNAAGSVALKPPRLPHNSALGNDIDDPIEQVDDEPQSQNLDDELLVPSRPAFGTAAGSSHLAAALRAISPDLIATDVGAARYIRNAIAHGMDVDSQRVSLFLLAEERIERHALEQRVMALEAALTKHLVAGEAKAENADPGRET